MTTTSFAELNGPLNDRIDYHVEGLWADAVIPKASQPTISRFEKGATRTALYRMGRELATRVIERHARRIVIDLDPTDDRTHGAQQMSFFNAYYDSWCYLPLLAFLTFDRESDHIGARPCCAPATSRPPPAGPFGWMA